VDGEQEIQIELVQAELDANGDLRRDWLSVDELWRIFPLLYRINCRLAKEHRPANGLYASDIPIRSDLSGYNDPPLDARLFGQEGILGTRRRD
jgi:hypothetical protein